MRQRLKAGQLFFFATCTEAIRTIPSMQHDPDRPEDLDTECEDHAADSVRYACMSRPYAARPPEQPKPGPATDNKGVWTITVNQFIDLHEGRRRGGRLPTV